MPKISQAVIEARAKRLSAAQGRLIDAMPMRGKVEATAIGARTSTYNALASSTDGGLVNISSRARDKAWLLDLTALGRAVNQFRHFQKNGKA